MGGGGGLKNWLEGQNIDVLGTTELIGQVEKWGLGNCTLINYKVFEIDISEHILGNSSIKLQKN